MSRFNIMYSSCFALNFFLHAMIYEYLISLLTITSIESYLSSIARFVDFGNLMIKFIVTSSHGDLDDF